MNLTFTKWDPFTPRKYKINLIRTLTFLTYLCFRICSTASLLKSATVPQKDVTILLPYLGLNSNHINLVLQ